MQNIGTKWTTRQSRRSDNRNIEPRRTTMADIVVTEFLDPAPLELLAKSYTVHTDTGLWNKRTELKSLMAGATGIIVRNRTQVDADLIAASPKLKVVGRLGVGLDNIDIPACKARKITVCPAIGANAVSVAEYVVGSALMLMRMAAFHVTQALVRGEWPREKTSGGAELAGKTLGIIGYGNIGQTVGERARAMGMKLIAHDDHVPPSSAAWASAKRSALDELLLHSDVITLHCPLTPETKGLIGAQELAEMKKGALLINTSRGGVVDEAAVAAALRSGHLGGAAIDVFDVEPIDKATGQIFANTPNLILTPHIAGVTRESNDRISTVTVENVMKVLGGRT
jgi:(S)-sulfolactate dehydrogenase